MNKIINIMILSSNNIYKYFHSLKYEISMIGDGNQQMSVETIMRRCSRGGNNKSLIDATYILHLRHETMHNMLLQ